MDAEELKSALTHVLMNEDMDLTITDGLLGIARAINNLADANKVAAGKIAMALDRVAKAPR